LKQDGLKLPNQSYGYGYIFFQQPVD